MAMALSLRSNVLAPFRALNRVQRPSTRSNFTVKAVLDPAAALAVTQQTIAFAAVIGGEAVYTGINTASTVPGRPSIPITLIGVAGTLAGASLISQGGSAGTTGCAVSFAAALFMMISYIQRVKNTPYDPREWPGAKSWPVVMCLISFFELAASTQGLLDAFSMLNQQ